MTQQDIIDDLFSQALKLPAEERAAFIAGLPKFVREHVVKLLEADGSADDLGLLNGLVDPPSNAIESTQMNSNADESTPAWKDGPTEDLTTLQLNDDPEHIGRYTVDRKLGQGGMGIVYLARDPELGRQVAIKSLIPAVLHDQTWLNRFQREARLTSALNHPNVLTIHEIGEADGVPYIATEFVDGTTLRDELNRQTLSVQESINTAEQIAKGLSAAHAAGIVHRDLKPDNVMIRNDGLVKILDFGLARLSHDSIQEASIAETISRSGLIVGTFSYMSPEQARGQELSVSSDIFSFGTLLYLMLTGERPFTGETASDLTAAILTRAPRPLSDFNIELPSRLTKLVMRCLNKQIEHRPTADEITTELSDLKDSSRVTIPTENTAANDAQPDSTVSGAATVLTDHDDLDNIRYTQSGDVNIAWQVIGDGPIDIVFVMGWVSHLEWFWKHPSFSSFLQRLASFSRLILFDKRGTGLSDKVPLNELPTLEMRMDDVRAVMEAAGSKRAVLVGVSEGGPLCTLFAATYPQKTVALAMMGCYARRLWAEDYPWGPTAEQRQVFLDELAANWGGPLGIEDRAPTLANDPAFRKWWASYLRMGASPGAAVALTKMNAQIDVRPILPTIQVPTLVLHRSGDRCLRVEEGRHMADLIPGAKFVELPGDDHLPFVGDAKLVLDEIEEFLTGCRQAPQVDRVLATVLRVGFESSQHTDKTLDQFHEMVSREADLFRGLNLIRDEQGIALTFDGPARAVRAAASIAGVASRVGLDVRCGLDTGACDITRSGLSGPAFETACNIANLAPIRGILASESLCSLVSGSGLEFIETSAAGASMRVFSLLQ